MLFLIAIDGVRELLAAPLSPHTHSRLCQPFIPSIPSPCGSPGAVLGLPLCSCLELREHLHGEEVPAVLWLGSTDGIKEQPNDPAAFTAGITR